MDTTAANAAPDAASTPDDPAAQTPREKLREQFREGKLDDRMVELDVRDRTQATFEVITSNSEEMESATSKTSSRPLRPAHQKTQNEGRRRLRVPRLRGRRPPHRHGSGHPPSPSIASKTPAWSSSTRSTKSPAARAATAPTSAARASSATSSHRRGHHRQHQVRHGLHRPHPLHRRRCLPRLETLRPHTRAPGPLPIRVELQSPHRQRLRAHPHRAQILLVKQATACSKPRASSSSSPPEAIAEMAQFAFRVNETTENIGARRLHTILERVLDEISFQAPDLMKPASPPPKASSPLSAPPPPSPPSGPPPLPPRTKPPPNPTPRHRAPDHRRHRKSSRRRPRIRPPTSRQHRQRSGPKPLHPLTCSRPAPCLDPQQGAGRERAAPCSRSR